MLGLRDGLRPLAVGMAGRQSEKRPRPMQLALNTNIFGAASAEPIAAPRVQRRKGLVAGRSSAAYTSMKHALVGLTRGSAGFLP